MTLGTPFLGAPKILSGLLFGGCVLPPVPLVGCLIDPSVVQQVARNFPGVAELDPSAAYFAAYPNAIQARLGDGQVNTLTASQIEAELASSNASLVAAARAWHAAVDAWAPADKRVKLLRMVGYDATTGSGCSAAPCSPAQVGSYVPTPPSGSSNTAATIVRLGCQCRPHFGVRQRRWDGAAVLRQSAQPGCGIRRSRRRPRSLLVRRLPHGVGVVTTRVAGKPVFPNRLCRLLIGRHRPGWSVPTAPAERSRRSGLSRLRCRALRPRRQARHQQHRLFRRQLGQHRCLQCRQRSRRCRRRHRPPPSLHTRHVSCTSPESKRSSQSADPASQGLCVPR